PPYGVAVCLPGCLYPVVHRVAQHCGKRGVLVARVHIPQDASNEVLRLTSHELGGDAIHIAVAPLTVERDEAVGDRLQHRCLTTLTPRDGVLRSHLGHVQAGAVDGLGALIRERSELRALIGAEWDR